MDNIKCIICLGENPITLENPLTKEHIIPEFMGGAKYISRVCKCCNEWMSRDFEVAVSKFDFYEIARYTHQINGKRKLVKHPFTGSYEDDTYGKFRINEKGEIIVIPEIEIKLKNKNLSLVGSIDQSDEKVLIEQVLLKLERDKEICEKFGLEALPSLAERLINTSDTKYESHYNPKVSKSSVFDIDAHIKLYTKIAFETAFDYFGDIYLDDPVAVKIRKSLQSGDFEKLKNLSAIAGLDPILDDAFDSTYHWVVLLKNICYIKIFNISWEGIFSEMQLFEKGHAGIVYKYCYKSKKYEKLNLSEHYRNMALHQMKINKK